MPSKLICNLFYCHRHLQDCSKQWHSLVEASQLSQTEQFPCQLFHRGHSLHQERCKPIDDLVYVVITKVVNKSYQKKKGAPPTYSLLLIRKLLQTIKSWMNGYKEWNYNGCNQTNPLTWARSGLSPSHFSIAWSKYLVAAG